MPVIEITVFAPRQVINVEAMRQAIIDKQNGETGPGIKQLFEQTTTGWRTPPDFSTRRADTASQLGIWIGPTGPNAPQYALVNAGAKPHPIFPRRAPRLRFWTGYTASTRPRVLRSQAYVRSGTYVSSAGVPMHPGFAAREFNKEIADQYRPRFAQEMNEAFAEGARHP